MVIHAVNSNPVSSFEDILVTQRIEGGGNGITISYDRSQINLKCSSLTVRGLRRPLTRGLSVIIENGSFTEMCLHQVNIIDFSGEELYVSSSYQEKFSLMTKFNLMMSDSLIIHQGVATPAQRGVYIFTSGSDSETILLQNITMSLRNVYTRSCT